jgi:hypothetical protein
VVERNSYDKNLLAFSDDGEEIRDPFLSPCGRFQVDPRQYGFAEWATGGGCKALRRELDGGHYLLLTDESGLDLPDPGDASSALLGRYDENGEELLVCRIADVVMYDEEPGYGDQGPGNGI